MRYHRAYSVIQREGQEDFWLNLGLVFPHKDGSGFNIMLQAFPLDGKIVCREITAEAEDASPNVSRIRPQCAQWSSIVCVPPSPASAGLVTFIACIDGSRPTRVGLLKILVVRPFTLLDSHHSRSHQQCWRHMNWRRRDKRAGR